MDAKFKSSLLKRKQHFFRDIALRAGRQRCYEEATGQVFDERIIPIQTASDQLWTRQEFVAIDPRHIKEHAHYLDACSRFKHEQVPGAKPAKGARSLTDLVIEFLVKNVADISPEALDCLPLQIIRHLWVGVSFRFPVSFETWQMFSKLLSKEDTTNLTLLRYRHKIRRPLSPLEVYATPLTSASFEFITSLSITASFSIQNLAILSKMTNIGVLEIIGPKSPLHDDKLLSPFPTIGDSLVRAWSRAACESDAFPVLRILRLCNHQGITTQSLAYLNKFKSLAIYDVSQTSVNLTSNIEAQKLGWRLSVLPTLDLLSDACTEREALFQTKLGHEPGHKKAPPRPKRELFDGSTVKRVPRSEIPRLLIKRASIAIAKEEEKIPIDSTKKGMKQRAEARRKEKEQTPPKHWDFYNLACFSRIGELRNDKDLLAAGIDIGDQPIVGDDLIPPIPIVSLQLGEEDKDLKNRSSMRTIVFTRIKFSDGGNQVEADQKPEKVDTLNKKRDHGRSMKKFGSVRNTKKQKIENVLDSFLL